MRFPGSFERVCRNYQRMESLRDSLPMEIDGIVYKIDDLATQNALRFYCPFTQMAVARKFPAQQAITQLLGVDFQVGRTGVLTPVARLRAGIHRRCYRQQCYLATTWTKIERLGLCIGDV